MTMASQRSGSRVLSTMGGRNLRSAGSRALALAIGLVLWCGANTGYALNGGTRVISCACQTPADFANAASADNSQWQVNSTYTVVSTVASETAYVKVTGHFHGNGEPIWTVGSATVVDASGNSLAGNTDAQQEAVFFTSDQVVFGVDRGLPLVITVVGSGNWGTMTDDQINTLIGGFLSANGITNPPPSVSLIFKDENGNDLGGASFNYNPSTHKYAFVEGFDAQGNPLDRHGNPVGKINTGGQGSGSASGAGGSLNWNIGGRDQCTDAVTISGDWGSTSSQLTQPC
jgi:hypothetical protein